MMMTKSMMAAALAVLATQAMATPEVKLTASLASVNVGDVFSVVLTAASFDAIAGKSIDSISGARDLAFTFTSGTLEVVSVTLAPRWTFGVSLGVVDAGAGAITGLRFGSFPAVTGTDFAIGTVTLRAIAAGAGTLDLVSGTFQGALGGVTGQSFSPAMGETTVAVVVPEPTSLAMLLAGLGCVALGARARPRG